MLREKSFHIRLLVIGLLPEHQVRQDADAAVALQRAFADLEHHAEVLVVVKTLAVQTPRCRRVFRRMFRPPAVQDVLKQLLLPVEPVHDAPEHFFYVLYAHMPVPSFTLCILSPLLRVSRADKVLPAQSVRLFLRAVNQVRFQYTLDVGEAVAAVPADLGERDATAVPVALQGAGAYSEYLHRFPAGNPPVRIAGGFSAIALADMLRYLFYPPRQFVKVGFFNHYHVHNHAVPIVYAAKLQGRRKADL